MIKAFVFSDLHASYKYLSFLREYLLEKKDIDFIVFAGDAVNMGEPVAFADKLVELIKETSFPFFWVPGNNDFGRAYHHINAVFKSLESRVVEYRGMCFTGVGGSPESWAGQYAGESIIDRKLIGGSIFVSHVPPPGALNFCKHDISPLLLNEKKENIKSGVKNYELSAKRFADAPRLHICGHNHSRWGCAYLGQTKIINPGSLGVGQYAILDAETLAVEFSRFN